VQLQRTGTLAADRLAVTDDLAAVMADASICGLGHTASSAITSALRLGLIGGRP
jgi:NADH-quinone oxidoreductase subunit F